MFKIKLFHFLQSNESDSVQNSIDSFSACEECSNSFQARQEQYEHFEVLPLSSAVKVDSQKTKKYQHQKYKIILNDFDFCAQFLDLQIREASMGAVL